MKDSNSKRGFYISCIVLVVIFLVFIEKKLLLFESSLIFYDSIWVLILINLNVIVLLVLIVLVFRHIVKLLYDRKRKVMGSKLRTRLVISFIFLSLLPTLVFLFPIKLINTNIDSWFDKSIIETFEKSIDVCNDFFSYIQNNQSLLVSDIIKKIEEEKLYRVEEKEKLERYISFIHSKYNLAAVGIYSKLFERLVVVSNDSISFSQRDILFNKRYNFDWSLGKDEIETDSIFNKEVIHTIGKVQFKAGSIFYIVCSFNINDDLYHNISMVKEGTKNYKTLISFKEPIKGIYYISLFIIAFLIVFCAIWFGFYLAKTIMTPVMELVDGIRRITDGDLNFRIKKTPYDDEIGSLVDSFNKMTSDFLASQQQLELSAKKLKAQNHEIEKRRRYMEMVLKSVSGGVITLDADGIITTFNTSAQKMLNLNANDFLNKSYNKLLKSSNLQFIGEILKNIDSYRKKSFEAPLHMTINGLPRSFLASINVLQGEEEKHHMGVVIVFDDLTELEKAQRMAAWREVARRIAHEVKNPLTPITLSAQRLRRKYSNQINEPVFVECIRMIIDHVDLIRNLVNEFSTFARFPAANPKICKISPIIEETIALYKEGHSEIEFNLKIDEVIPDIKIDRQQIKQALINLINNAVVALKNKGSITITLSYDLILKSIKIEVADNGFGIRDEDKNRLFEPNFSTRKSGMGLGLTIVHTIITDHGGLVSVKNNEPRGAKFTIELPT